MTQLAKKKDGFTLIELMIVVAILGILSAIAVPAVSFVEGVEAAEDSEACRELGFQLGQGFYYGRPAPSSYSNAAENRSLLR